MWESAGARVQSTLDHKIKSPDTADSGMLGNAYSTARERQNAVLKKETGAELQSCKWEASAAQSLWHGMVQCDIKHGQNNIASVIKKENIMLNIRNLWNRMNE